jgi:hypothetical protein
LDRHKNSKIGNPVKRSRKATATRSPHERTRLCFFLTSTRTAYCTRVPANEKALVLCRNDRCVPLDESAYSPHWVTSHRKGEQAITSDCVDTIFPVHQPRTTTSRVAAARHRCHKQVAHWYYQEDCPQICSSDGASTVSGSRLLTSTTRATRHVVVVGITSTQRQQWLAIISSS